MAKAKLIADDYPDADGDGIPDVFENRKPLAEMLDFSSATDTPPVIPVVTWATTPPGPEPRAWITVKQLEYYKRIEKEWKPPAETAYPPEPAQCTPVVACNHSGAAMPIITCVHVITKRAHAVPGRTNAPSYGNAYCTTYMCERNHAAADIRTACVSCLPPDPCLETLERQERDRRPK